MRILQIVALVSGTNAYGGPTTVAFNQCRALADAGHDVVLAATGSELGTPLPTERDGVRTALFPPHYVLPGAGFAGLTSPAMLSWVRRVAPSADVVHVHMARDLLTLPAAWLAQRAGTRTVLQTHGMIDPSENPLAGPLDAALTRRVLRDAHRIFHLTPREQREVAQVARGPVNLMELHNGMPVGARSRTARTDGTCRVLFLARLQERKRPLAFVAAARSLAQRFPHATFTLVGPDEGQGDAVRRAITDAELGDRLTWAGPVDSAGAAQWMRDSDLYVLPSVDEPYPMSVLEAMSSGLPVVITDTCGLADTVQRTGSGAVVDDSQPDLERALAELLSDPDLRERTGRAARDTIAREYGMDAVRERLLRAYQD